MAPEGYLHRVLADGTKPFRYRCRVRALLGLAAETGIRTEFVTPTWPDGFVYRSGPPEAGEPPHHSLWFDVAATTPVHAAPSTHITTGRGEHPPATHTAEAPIRTTGAPHTGAPRRPPGRGPNGRAHDRYGVNSDGAGHDRACRPGVQRPESTSTHTRTVGSTAPPQSQALTALLGRTTRHPPPHRYRRSRP